jgi:hypothetical protein
MEPLTGLLPLNDEGNSEACECDCDCSHTVAAAAPVARRVAAAAAPRALKVDSSLAEEDPPNKLEKAAGVGSRLLAWYSMMVC